MSWRRVFLPRDVDPNDVLRLDWKRIPGLHGAVMTRRGSAFLEVSHVLLDEVKNPDHFLRFRHLPFTREIFRRALREANRRGALYLALFRDGNIVYVLMPSRVAFEEIVSDAQTLSVMSA